MPWTGSHSNQSPFNFFMRPTTRSALECSVLSIPNKPATGGIQFSRLPTPRELHVTCTTISPLLSSIRIPAVSVWRTRDSGSPACIRALTARRRSVGPTHLRERERLGAYELSMWCGPQKVPGEKLTTLLGCSAESQIKNEKRVN